MSHSITPLTGLQAAPRADSDAGVIALWLGNYRSLNTRGAYATDIKAFARFVGMPLAKVTLGEVQAFAASLNGMKPASQSRRLSAVKSLIGFAHRLGYLAFDTAAPIQLPAIQDDLAQKILTEWQVQRMLEMERNPRNAAMLRLLYSSGVRVSELCGLRWKHLQARDEGGQITVLGKGGKTRAILLPPTVYDRVAALRRGAGPDGPVFRSRQSGPLVRGMVHRIVKAAAKRARLSSLVSAHWMRHAHASHALDRSAPVHVVQATLGHASLMTTTRYTHVRPGDSSSKYLTV